MNILFFLFFLISMAIDQVPAQNLRLPPSQVSYPEVNFDDIKLSYQSGPENLQARWSPQSWQWIRQDQLVWPKAILIISASERFLIMQSGEKINSSLMQNADGHNVHQLLLPVALFHYKQIELVFASGEKKTIHWSFSHLNLKSSIIVQDTSCRAYSLNISAPSPIILSLGCYLHRQGKFGSETPTLEIIALSPLNKQGVAPIQKLLIHPFEHGNISLQVPTENENEDMNIELQARLPERLHRFKTALGLGPYLFDNTKDGNKRRGKGSMSAMLYGNFYLTDQSSFRFFEAVVAESAIFNNLGLYFAYTVAEVMDSRLSFVPLLGLQHLAHRYDSGDKFFTEMIYPQGIEINYYHPFDLSGWILSYGIFANPTSSEDYLNTWVRVGKRLFTEVNYIYWSRDQRAASMLGISLGFPLIGVL